MTDPQPDPLAEMDQALRGLKDIARFTRAVYTEHIDAGFSKWQAFSLARAWFLQTTTSKEAE